MQGRLGGNITKNAAFASGSSVIINGGNSSSVYDFSLSGANGGALIVVKLDFAKSKKVTDGTISNGDTNTDYLHSTILGLDGLTSIAGTLSNTVIGADSASANQVRFSGNLSGAGGHWFVTESSTIDSLIIENDSTLLNSANIRASTHNNALAIIDLSTYDWEGHCHDGTTTCNTTQQGQNGEYDYYDLIERDLGAGFSKKTLTIGTSTMANGTTHNSLFSSSNGVFKLGLNLSATGEKADEIQVVLTQDMQGSGSRIQLIQDKYTPQNYRYQDGDEKIYVASVIDSTAGSTGGTTGPNFGIGDTTFRATEQYVGLRVLRTTLATDGNELIDSGEFNDDALNGGQYWGKKWYIESIYTEQISASDFQTHIANPLEGAALSPYLNLYTETNNMAKRMGELRGANDASGAWVKLIKGALSSTNGYYANNMGVQGGFDKRTDIGDTRVYWGVVGSFMNIWGNNSGHSAQSNSFSLGAYRSTLYRDGSYLDIVGKYIYSANQYNSHTEYLSGNPRSGVHSAYVSAEYGRRMGIKTIRGFYLQPQAEIIAGYIGGQNLHFEDSRLGINVPNTFALIARAGVDAGSTFAMGSKSGYWRVGASLVGDVLERGQMTVVDLNDSRFTETHSFVRDFRAVFSAGLDMRLSKNSRIYFEIDKSFFGRFNIDYLVSAGLRFNFGTNPRRQAPQSYPNFYDQQYINTYPTGY